MVEGRGLVIVTRRARASRVVSPPASRVVSTPASRAVSTPASRVVSTRWTPGVNVHPSAICLPRPPARHGPERKRGRESFLQIAVQGPIKTVFEKRLPTPFYFSPSLGSVLRRLPLLRGHRPQDGVLSSSVPPGSWSWPYPWSGGGSHHSIRPTHHKCLGFLLVRSACSPSSLASLAG